MELEGYDRRRYLIIQCLDNDAFRLFDYFVHDLESSPSALNALSAKIEDYRYFWSQPTNRLSPQEALGLFGELWFMEVWLPAHAAYALSSWTGHKPLLHDFSFTNTTIEVKATQKGLPATHKIGSLEQLQPQDGRSLLLFSLAVRQDRAAGTLLTDLIESYRDRLTPLGLSSQFDRLLAKRGFRPDDDNNPTFRYILRSGGERLYEVRAGFPRLQGGSFSGGRPPAGVGGISYEISLAGFEDYVSELCAGFDAPALSGPPSHPMT
jgi:hypothetical protein